MCSYEEHIYNKQCKTTKFINTYDSRYVLVQKMKAIKLTKSVTLSITALVIVATALTVTTLAAITSNQTVTYSGTVTAVNLGVYTDSGCTQPCTSISAVAISPGSSVTQTIYVKNNGNVAETLTMAVSSWSPSNANTYLTLSWNRQSTVLNAGASVQATLTLTAASNCGSLTDFSCSVTITGTQ
jgi:hypothetical protein